MASSNNHQFYYITLSCFVGIFTGIICSYFQIAIHTFETWPRILAQYIDGAMLIICAAILVMVSTVLISYLVRNFAPEAEGSGLSYMEIEMTLNHTSKVRWIRILIVKFFLGIASLSSGLLVGKEGPSMQIGSVISIGLVNIFKSGATPSIRNNLMAAGTAAGLACAFNAPIAAMLFVMMEMKRLSLYSLDNFLGVTVASITATMMNHLILGGTPLLTIPIPDVPLILLPVFIFLGIILGVMGIYFNKGLLWTSALAQRMQRKLPYLYPALMGLIVGALCIVFPLATTSGEHFIPQIISEHPNVIILISIVILRFFGTIGSYAIGVPGGIFTTLLSLSVFAGLAFSALISLIFPDMAHLAVVFGIVAMGGLFTSSIQSLLTAVVLVLELTNGYNIVIPLLTTCVVAAQVSIALGGKGIYTLLYDISLNQEIPTRIEKA